MVGIAGKAVLEVGGALPPELVLRTFGAGAWTAIEDPAYYDQHGQAMIGDRPALEPLSAGPAATGAYRYMHCAAEFLPDAFDGRFDLAFSIAAFEHFARLPLALDRLHAALRPGGKLFALFSPVWPCRTGHHLPESTVLDGKAVRLDPALLKPWDHLLYAPPELFALLAPTVGRALAAEIVRLVHHAPHINRLFVEDYVAYLTGSPFAVDDIRMVFPSPPPPEIQQALEARHPGHREFGFGGMVAILSRAPGPSAAA
ncbi:MAG: class I SAM-dependent methyltransferase [Alphaproteobacteria bacterium]|nr:class I SAM-dependent methyltransferase [Alphaproteobacteria bacterium]